MTRISLRQFVLCYTGDKSAMIIAIASQKEGRCRQIYAAHLVAREYPSRTA
jgi:hypothetical protein